MKPKPGWIERTHQNTGVKHKRASAGDQGGDLTLRIRASLMVRRESLWPLESDDTHI